MISGVSAGVARESASAVDADAGGLTTTACPTGAEIGYDVSNVAKLLEIPRPADPYDLLNPQQRAAVRHGEGPLPPLRSQSVAGRHRAAG